MHRVGVFVFHLKNQNQCWIMGIMGLWAWKSKIDISLYLGTLCMSPKQRLNQPEIRWATNIDHQSPRPKCREILLNTIVLSAIPLHGFIHTEKGVNRSNQNRFGNPRLCCKILKWRSEDEPNLHQVHQLPVLGQKWEQRSDNHNWRPYSFSV